MKELSAFKSKSAVQQNIMFITVGSILSTCFRRQEFYSGLQHFKRFCTSINFENQVPSDEFYHTPILLNECCQFLDIKAGGLYIDCTLGGGGHAKEILKRGGKVIGLDQDIDAVRHSTNRLKNYIDNSQLEIIQTNFRKINSVIVENSRLYKSHIANIQSSESNNSVGVDGVLMDLGISSHQIDFRDRGFSFQGDGPLDMRMNRDESDLTAHQIVNQYTVEDIANILYSKKIALIINIMLLLIT